MHSSRMHTGRSLTVCRSLLPWGGVSAPRGGVCSWGGVCSRGGCLLPEGVCALEGVCSWGVSAPLGCLRGCLLWGGVCSRGCLLLGGVCSRGVSALRGMSTPRGVSAHGVCSRGVSTPGGVWYPSMH